MKKFIAILFVVVLTLIIIKANAQGKGHGHGKGHVKHEWKKDEHTHLHIVVEHTDSRHAHKIVARHFEKPRYVYFTDYDIFFDNHRNVYISYSKGSWTMSRTIPVRLRNVDSRSMGCHDVDYYDDDLVSYLDRGQPMYTNIYVRQ